MFGNVKYLKVIQPGELDEYLENGWYRMQQSIFTAHFINYQNDFYNLVWLRNRLDDYTESSTSKKLKKLNSKFRIEVAPFNNITDGHIALFKKYSSHKPLGWPSSLTNLLLNGREENIYNSFVLNLYEGTVLIGTCVFDVGNKSAAGITSFYDPEYSSFSLGKYLIYRVVEHCKQMQLEYFYPGYFAPGIKEFDYKLGIGNACLEYYDLPASRWLPLSEYSSSKLMLPKMLEKLTQLRYELRAIGIASTLAYYAHFNFAAEVETAGGIWDFPVFLYCDGGNNFNLDLIVVYNPIDSCYHLYSSEKCSQSEDFFGYHGKTVFRNMFDFADSYFKSHDIKLFANVLRQVWAVQ